MGELRALPGRKSEDDAPCYWCHESYPCHGKGFGPMNCPRVSAYSFLDWEQVHEDGWYIGAVQFREEITLEAEVEDDASQPDAAESS
jgi:hypothetical protein